MAKLQLLPVLAGVVLALAGVVLANDPATAAGDAAAKPDHFVLEGRVYCDTCRTGFETELTSYMPGAKVKLECKRYGTDEITYTAEATTDASGNYEIRVPDDHADEQCSVVLVKSSVEGCTEVETGRDRARVVLAQDGGVVSNVRRASPLGYLIGDPLPECGTMLQKYGFGIEEDD